MTVSEAVRTLSAVAEGTVDPSTTIYGEDEYYVKLLHLDSETNVELQYKDGELMDGYVIRNGSSFSLSVEELELADIARQNYEMAERIRRLEATHG